MRCRSSILLRRRALGRAAGYCIAAAATVGTDPAFGQLTNVTWNLGQGFWSNPVNWSPPMVPNNGFPPGTFYNAFVDGGNPSTSRADIVLGESFTVNNLMISSNDVVNVAGQLGVSGGTLASGMIGLGNNAQLQLMGGTLAIGGGSIAINGPGSVIMDFNAMTPASQIIGAPGAATLNVAGPDSGIVGQGLIRDVNLINSGQILVAANVIGGGSLTIRPGPGRGFRNAGLLGNFTGPSTTILDGIGGGTFDLSAGQLNFNNGGTVLFVNNPAVSVGNTPILNSQFNVSSGTISAGFVTGTGTINQTGGAYNLTHFRIGALISSGGTLTVAAGGGTIGTSRLSNGTISVGGTGRVDLNDHSLAVDYSLMFGGGGLSPLDAVRAALTAGYNGGLWNGEGGIVSTAAALAGDTALGYAEASDIFTVFPAPFEGITVDETTVLVRYTKYGDADLNGITDLGDFSRLAANFGQGPGTLLPARDWDDGDFNYDQSVDIGDFALLAANFNENVASRTVPSVPEPSWAGLALVVLLSVGWGVKK